MPDKVWLQVQEVRDYIKTVDGFKSVKIIERDKSVSENDNCLRKISA